MTEYYDGLRVEKEKNSAVPSAETADGLKGYTAGPWKIHGPNVLGTWTIFTGDTCNAFNQVCQPDTLPDARLIAAAPDLLAILREALKEADDNPERYEVHAFCNECAEGNRPLRYEYRLCWIHKARKLIGEAQ